LRFPARCQTSRRVEAPGRRPEFRQPFDLLAAAAVITRGKTGVETPSHDRPQGKLPGQDSNLEKQDQNLL
jgi:hypothetical protein